MGQEEGQTALCHILLAPPYELIGDELPLTDLQCRNAKGSVKNYKLYDAKGLYLEVIPSGKRFWRFRYNFFGKEKRFSLGEYPGVSLVAARDSATTARITLASGTDPSIHRQQEKLTAQYAAHRTLELIGREWHQHYHSNWDPKHAELILERLEREIFTPIGHYPIKSVTPAILLKVIQRVEGRKAFDLAHRLLQHVGQIFRYAVVTERAERDITTDLRDALKPYANGHYASIEIDELPDLVKAINENQARLYRQTILAIKLMMLTFVRTKEMIFAKWSEIDFDKAIWTIPAERMKGKKANLARRPDHIVPLSKQALEILNELHEMNGKRTFVFPSVAKPSQCMSNGAILGGLKRLGYANKMTGHGFRALAMSTIKERLGYRHEVVDRQLAHVPKSRVDKAYDRAKFLTERMKMMQDWADYIDKL